MAIRPKHAFFNALTSMFLAVVVSVSLAGQPDTGTAEPTLSRYQRTVHRLIEDDDSAQQADFAATGLRELVEVYLAEADLARAQAKELPAGRVAKLQRWSHAVERYAEQLYIVMEEVQTGAPVKLTSDLKGSAGARIADRVVIFQHPRADQQRAFEQRLLQDFCQRNDCRTLIAVVEPVRPIPVTASQVNPEWLITSQGAVCAHGGIVVRFGPDADLGRARGICEQLMSEAELLAADIAWQARHGVRVDWGVLTVTAVPRRPEHLVDLNAYGDTVLVNVPLIHGSPGLLASLKPWLSTRYTQSNPTALELEATQIGWQVKKPRN
jgi:hypothetical protein